MIDPVGIQRARRSLLFMPGDSLRKIEKAATLAVDSIVMDLEDGVAPARKEAARAAVLQALRSVDFGGRERLVRANPVAGPLARDDIMGTVAGLPDGYVLPKVESAQDVEAAGALLAAAERAHGLAPGRLRLLAGVETAAGIMNLRKIAAAGAPRLEALLFGAEDLAGDLGATRTREGWEIFYARSAVVTAAAAYGLQAIDMIFTGLHDLAGLEEECCRAAQMGYAGKMAIHPNQLPAIHAAFTPSAEQVAQAQRLLEAFAAQQALGAGVFELDGKMVDMPMVRAARRILERARPVG